MWGLFCVVCAVLFPTKYFSCGIEECCCCFSGLPEEIVSVVRLLLPPLTETSGAEQIAAPDGQKVT